MGSFGGFGSTQGGLATKISSAAFPLLAPNGTAAAPSYSFSGDPNTGFYSVGSSSYVAYSADGASIFLLGTPGLRLGSAMEMAWSSAAAPASAGQDLILVRDAAAVLQMGSDVNGSAVNQTFKAHDGITGTDIAGASLTLAGGRGTGAGTGSSLIFSTSTTLGTGTTAQTLVTRLTLSKGAVTTDAVTLTFADKVDLVFNGTTGTKIGTAGSQKIGFYGATPVVQPTGVAVSAAGIHAALVTLGLITA